MLHLHHLVHLARPDYLRQDPNGGPSGDEEFHYDPHDTFQPQSQRHLLQLHLLLHLINTHAMPHHHNHHGNSQTSSPYSSSYSIAKVNHRHHNVFIGVLMPSSFSTSMTTISDDGQIIINILIKSFNPGSCRVGFYMLSIWAIVIRETTGHSKNSGVPTIPRKT